MDFSKQQERLARQEAVVRGQNPDEVVSTDLVDSDHNHVEMPIWRALAYKQGEARTDAPASA